MQKVSFKVTGNLPPKKGGDLSMWGKSTDTEPKRLLALRRKALQALNSSPFTEPIRLTLSIHVGDGAPVFTDAGKNGFGDLDTFVSGVCDGLMAAHPRAKINPLFRKAENADVHPRKVIAIRDDQQVMEINAKKIIGPGNHCWYEVGLEQLEDV